MTQVALQVNGETVSADVPDRTHLGDFLRENAGLTGTHLGCEHGVCGTCTVLLDGVPIRSCISFAVACDGSEITTVEGYDGDPLMKHLRAAFNEHHALQSGYCTPGMLACARDIILRFPDADEARIRLELSGNLCRCTGYQGIVNAIADVLRQCRSAPDLAIDVIRQKALATPGVEPTNNPGTRDTDATAQPISENSSSPTPFSTFEAHTVSDSPGSGKSAEHPPKQHATNQKNNRIDDRFVLPYPADAVWSFMGDLPRVANCLPGASIDSHEADRVKGKIAIRFGPMSASFVGGARLLRDDANLTATFQGAGQDSLSQSRTNAQISYSLTALTTDQTAVEVSIEYALQGPLAQFSRSGLVRDFVKRMIQDFAQNVERQLGGDPLPVGSTPAAMHAGGSLLAVVWNRFTGPIRRLFGSARPDD